MVAAAAFFVACSGLAPTVHAQKGAPDFGDDSSRWAKDGECDDRRFTGDGMTPTTLLDTDIGHDATDCRAAWNSGGLVLAADQGRGVRTPEFGDDASEWANDDECDDPRFSGDGMTNTELLEDDLFHDATDCRKAWRDGELMLVGINGNGTPRFGDDDGDYSDDGECDDMRFIGKGMGEGPFLSDDIMHDASDCKAAWNAGDIKLR